MAHEMLPPEALREKSEKEIIQEIVRLGTFEHVPDRPNLFRAYFSYGSKELMCYTHKDSKEAGGVLEASYPVLKREKETSLLYRALHAFLQGVSNRMGEPLAYVFRTENEKLIAWGKSQGNEIFSWSDIRIHDDGVVEFFSTIMPTITSRTAERRRQYQEAKILVWESREELR